LLLLGFPDQHHLLFLLLFFFLLHVRVVRYVGEVVIEFLFLRQLVFLLRLVGGTLLFITLVLVLVVIIIVAIHGRIPLRLTPVILRLLLLHPGVLSIQHPLALIAGLLQLGQPCHLRTQPVQDVVDGEGHLDWHWALREVVWSSARRF
jgi:hypothetical protein